MIDFVNIALRNQQAFYGSSADPQSNNKEGNVNPTPKLPKQDGYFKVNKKRKEKLTDLEKAVSFASNTKNAGSKDQLQIPTQKNLKRNDKQWKQNDSGECRF